jgi:hypothetical protein
VCLPRPGARLLRLQLVCLGSRLACFLAAAAQQLCSASSCARALLGCTVTHAQVNSHADEARARPQCQHRLSVFSAGAACRLALPPNALGRFFMADTFTTFVASCVWRCIGVSLVCGWVCGVGWAGAVLVCQCGGMPTGAWHASESFWGYVCRCGMVSAIRRAAVLDSCCCGSC